jgi:hypothetical protein
MRKLVIAVAVAVAAVLGLVGGTANAQVTAPAATQGSAALCTPAGNIVGECVNVAGLGFGSDPQPDPCQHCPAVVALAVSTVPPVHRDELDGDLLDGMALLGRAAVAAKDDRAELRAEAQATFVAAGAVVGKTPLGRPGAGYVDPTTGAYVPQDKGWRVDVATRATDGLNLLRSQPTQQAVTQAMGDFDAAYAEFVASSLPDK